MISAQQGLGVLDELKHAAPLKGQQVMTQLQTIVATWEHRFIADKSFHFSRNARKSVFYAKSHFKHYLLHQLLENGVDQ